VPRSAAVACRLTPLTAYGDASKEVFGSRGRALIFRGRRRQAVLDIVWVDACPRLEVKKLQKFLDECLRNLKVGRPGWWQLLYARGDWLRPNAPEIPLRHAVF